MALEARLTEFKELSQLDQAGCLNAISDRKVRESVIEHIFGEDGWTGGVTSGGILVTSSVANAINAFKVRD
jgi:hypothetical protein